MKRLFWTFTFLFLAGNLFSQIDNEFWFVAPEASINHGDQPVLLRVSTMESPANITLRMPADLFFPPLNQFLPPNSTFTFNLTVPWKDTIENKPADQVLNKGLLLTSDSLVTAYYEISNASNPAIFPFKGKNALGTEFWISGQNNYPNQTNDGSEAFDIVATEDGTRVTITPAIDIVGHVANVPFQIILNKGQTYSARTLNTTAAATLGGSHVVADKPVAITISDDSIITGGWDIIGDQTIPVNLLGWKYIVVKGYADNSPPNNDDERVYILATRDNTDIYLDGGGAPVTTLNTGQQYCYAFPAANNTAYFNATNPVYVYHLSGNPGEAGSSIIPEDSCTGSPQISFTRTTANFFAMLILTKNGNQDSFYLNGSNTIIPGTSFTVVPGTGGQWVYYRNSMTVGQVPQGTNLLKNTLGKFHLGIINNVGASSEYGYYSAYSSLNLGADRNICPGDSVRLDAGPYMISYAWQKLESGTWTLIDTNRYITIHDTGFYSCMVNGDFCTLLDTIHIGLYPNASVSLGPDKTICEGTTITLDPGPFVYYLWSTGATTPKLITGNEGTYWVRVTNNNGCVASDTVVITLDSLPKATGALFGPGTVCQGQTGVVYTMDPEMYATSYSWTLPPGYNGSSTTNIISIDFSLSALSDTIRVRGVNVCGQGPEMKIHVTVDPVPGAAGAISGTSTVCQGQGGIAYSIPPVTHAFSYVWSLPPGATINSGSGTNNIIVDFALNAASGNITVFATNNCGNSNTSVFPVTVNLFPVPAGAISGPSTVCQGQAGIAYSVPVITGADSYLWALPSGVTITSGAGTNNITVAFDSTLSVSGNISVTGHSNNCGDGTPSSLAVTVNPLPSPAGPVTGISPVCQGQNGVSYSISPLANTNTYIWSLPPGSVIASGAGTNSITVNFGSSAVSGLITVHGQNLLCGNGRSSSFSVIVNPQPTPTITGPASVCLNSTTGYSTEAGKSNYTWTVSAGGAITGGQGTAGITVLWSTTGPQTVTVNYQDANGCAAITPTSYAVTVNILPVPALNGQASICSGFSATYTTDAGMANYAWIVSAGGTVTAGGGPNDASVTVHWTVVGPQSVSVNYILGSGCTAANPTVLNVTVNALPVPVISGTAVVCAGTAGVMYSCQSAMSNYLWTVSAGGSATSGGGTGDNFVTVTWNNPGAQNVSVNFTNSNGCTALAPSVFPVTVNPLPVPTISGPGSVCLNSTTSYFTEPGKVNYSWTVSAGGTITGGAGTGSISVLWNTPGAKTITVNYFDANGCTAAAPTSYNVTVNTLPVPVLNGLSNICVNNSAVYTTDPGMSNYSWIVSAGGIITSGGGPNDATATILWSAAGARFVSINYFAGSGCTAPGPTVLNVNVKPRPAVTNAANSSICSGGSVNIPVSADLPGTTFTWTATPSSPNVTGFHPGNGPVITDVLVNTGSNIESVTYAVTPSLNGCDGTIANFIVTVYPVANVSFNPNGQTLCSGVATSISLSSGVAGTTFSWTATGSSPNITGFGPGNGNTIAQTLTNTGFSVETVTYQVTPVANGCTGTGNDVLVTVNPRPAVTFTICFDPVTTTIAKPINLKGGIPPGGTYSGTGVSTGIFYPSLAGPGNHNLQYSYTNMYGCPASASVSINVLNPLPFFCNSILTDVRDNKQYPTVQIGTQCWMASNLDYGSAVPSSAMQRDNCIAEKYCFNDVPALCATRGALYQWDEMMQFDNAAAIQGLCPPGWHIPAEGEWNSLFLQYISHGFAGAPLKSTGYSGFNAFLYGSRLINTSWNFDNFATILWSSTAIGSYKAWAHGMNSYNPSVSLYPGSRSNAFSVRCLKD